MAEYRARLTLQSALATPLLSGTLFGHLCWAKRYLDSESALVQWLDALPEQPLLLSDAFPAGCLPRPLLAPVARPRLESGMDRGAFKEKMQRLKKQRKAPWISVKSFIDLRGGVNEARLLSASEQTSAGIKSVRQAHNTINRHTGTTPESGGLYFMDETWRDDRANTLDVYLQGALSAEELQRWFDLVGEFGFGRDASLGRGRFIATVEPADNTLFQHTGNRLLSLSHGTLTPNMAAPRYQLHTHYGKLGGLYAGGVYSPFKYPISLTRPGMTFSPMASGPYGELLSNVHPRHPGIRHHAWHLCLPYTESID